MRPLYLLLRITLPYALFVFYRRTKTLNDQKKFNAQTIFVCNHPSAFIDPLVAANFQRPIMFFATRGDVFSTWLHPITWASHMVPIFRTAQDGADSHQKNKDSFSYLGNVLLRKKSLILFGEGYTDDVFIRSLKPLKKGPARIGFETMERIDWEQDIKVQTIGLNYSHPKYFRSDMLMSLGDIIHLKDYKEIYDDSPTKAVTELTRRVQKSMQEQITYVKNKEVEPFLEKLLILSRRGMNNFHFDKSNSLESRFLFSRALANKINEEYDAENAEWAELKLETDTYFDAQKKEGINENWIAGFARTKSKNLLPRILYMVFGFPIAFLGFLHNFIPYILIKTFVEHMFKRDVFWSGVKMILGAAASALINIPAIFLFQAYVYDNIWLALAYYITIPALTGIFAYDYFKSFGDTLRLIRVEHSKLEDYAQKRAQLLKKIKTLGLFN